MPLVVIYGLPTNVSETTKLLPIIGYIKTAVAEIKELGLTGDDVSVFMPPDRVIQGLGEEIIAIVDLLYKMPARTKPVKTKLAEAIALILQREFPKAKIEVFVRTFDQHEDGAFIIATPKA